MSESIVPYPGLRPFEEKDREIFFGREAQIVSVLSLLEEQQFVAVVGSSGSGKSSLILAGVIPAVRQGFLRGTPDWKILVFKPGSDPCGNLARALEREGAVYGVETAAVEVSGRMAASERRTLVEKLHAADRSLIDLVTPPRTGSEGGAISSSSAATLAEAEEVGGPRVLIVVDQFEELFTFRRAQPEAASQSAHFASRDEAATFVRLLLRACADPRGRIAIVITLRSDFIGDCDAFLDLPELVSRCQFLVPRLDRSQLRETIERPGELDDLGYEPFTFEDGLVNRIIVDAGDRLDQLPLMQHALMRTWKLAGGVSSTRSGARQRTQALRAWTQAGGQGAPARPLVTLTQEHTAWRAASPKRSPSMPTTPGPRSKATPRKPAWRAGFSSCSPICMPTAKSFAAGRWFPKCRPSPAPASRPLKRSSRCFQADDRNFLLPVLKRDEHLNAADHLDISHEALLRQWKEFGKWLAEEAESKRWLRELSQAAKD